MSRNIEIKARVEGIEELEILVASISDSGPDAIFQDDTFFKCASGRLKLRMFSQQEGELIFYQRKDQLGPAESFYLRSTTTDPATLRESLILAYGEAGRVIKQRTLFLIGRTRIHVDRVDGLGDFIELEVVLEEGEDADVGIAEAERILQQLGIDKTQLMEQAYVDLVSKNDSALASHNARH